MIEPQSTAAARLEEALDPLLQHIRTTLELPGLAVGVAQEGQVVYARGFGVRNMATQEPITATSLFHMASVSKTFVATAVMQLWEQGRVGLDAPVVQYLPYFELADERCRTITVGQMLSHTAGMPDVEDYQWDQPEYDAGAAERYVRSLRGEKLIAAPGEKFAYSNMAFEVLGDLIAKVSGEPFEDYVKEHLLDPLGMHASTFLREKVSPELATSPHLRLPTLALSEVYPYHRAHAPSSTLHSSAVEMCAWGMAHLNRGTLHGRQILAPTSYDPLWQPRARTGWDEDPCAEEIGLGWFLGQHRSIRSVSHAGCDVGYNTYFVLLPEKALAVVVLTNVVPGFSRMIADIVLDVVLGFTPQLPLPPILRPLGHVLVEQGREAAIAHYHESAASLRETCSLDSEPWIDTAEILIEQKRFVAAVDLLYLARDVYPDDWWTYKLLGEAYMKSGDREQAIANLQKALQIKPDSTEAAKMLQQLAAGSGRGKIG